MSSLKLFFDIDAASDNNKSGVGYYSLELLRSLSNIDNIEITAHYFNFFSRHKSSLPELPNVSYKTSKLLHRKAYNFLRRMGIDIPIEILGKQRFSYGLFPNFISKPSIYRTKSCVVVHDFAYLEYSSSVSSKNRRDLERFVKKSLHNVSFVICISETMKNKLSLLYPDYNKQVIVTKIPPPYIKTVNEKMAGEILKKFSIKKDYFLFIGNKEPRKNLNNLIKAYSKTISKFKESNQLVLVGNSGWNEGIDRELLDNIQQDIIETGYVTDKEKYALIKGAKALIIPSIYEGYGMPIIEAMYLKTPVIASRIPVFEEISGGYCHNYFDPNSINDITLALENFKPDTRVINQAYKLASCLDWTKVAKDITEQMYKS